MSDSLPKAARTVPAALVDAAMVCADDICAAALISRSRLRDLIAAGLLPDPVVRRARATRWRAKDIRKWLEEDFIAISALTNHPGEHRQQATKAAREALSNRRVRDEQAMAGGTTT